MKIKKTGALELRKMTTKKINKCLWEIELYLMRYEGVREDPSSAGDFLAGLARGEHIFRDFAAELRRRAGRRSRGEGDRARV